MRGLKNPLPLILSVPRVHTTIRLEEIAPIRAENVVRNATRRVTSVDNVYVYGRVKVAYTRDATTDEVTGTSYTLGA